MLPSSYICFEEMLHAYEITGCHKAEGYNSHDIHSIETKIRKKVLSLN